jgi:protocatechuate 3,4-dioxygenase beta subunit
MTRIRMPRMQGRPPHCSMFTVIRSINSGLIAKIGLSDEDFKHWEKGDLLC